MNTFFSALPVIAAATWLLVLLLPWRPWLNGETLEALPGGAIGPGEVTVLIPARNEADVIASTLQGLAEQGGRLAVVLVDDGSEDETVERAKAVQGIDLRLLSGEELPPGWSGKLWALEQGAKEIQTPWTLLLDADIRLAPGMLAALLAKAKADRRQFVSIMARLRMEAFWEKLLMPAFVYFFKLLYPFRLSNSDFPHVAAAAGGCILLETRLLRETGGFAAIRGALIDDCSLAKLMKKAGHRIWVGQSHGVVSLREYQTLEPIWDMVARSAFTQLRYSGGLLALCSGLMAILFVAPVAGIVVGAGAVAAWSAVAYLCMVCSYWPTLRYYRINALWAWAMPAVAALYLAMTWTSALRYWRGDRSRWKNRVYAVQEAAD